MASDAESAAADWQAHLTEEERHTLANWDDADTTMFARRLAEAREKLATVSYQYAKLALFVHVAHSEGVDAQNASESMGRCNVESCRETLAILEVKADAA